MNIDEEKELKENVNRLLEETVEQKENYKDERKLIFSMLENLQNRNDIETLNIIFKMFKRIINLEQEKEKYNIIISELNKIQKEQTRKQDNNISTSKTLNLFLINDKKGNTYTFFLRENAKKYIEENSSKFDKETEIKIIQNENIDLENWIKSTYINFI